VLKLTTVRQYKRHRRISNVARAASGSAAVLAAVLAVRAFPDLRRYLSIRNM
jgi:hypothetical protein